MLGFSYSKKFGKFLKGFSKVDNFNLMAYPKFLKSVLLKLQSSCPTMFKNKLIVQLSLSHQNCSYNKRFKSNTMILVSIFILTILNKVWKCFRPKQTIGWIPTSLDIIMFSFKFSNMKLHMGSISILVQLN